MHYGNALALDISGGKMAQTNMSAQHQRVTHQDCIRYGLISNVQKNDKEISNLADWEELIDGLLVRLDVCPPVL